MSYLFRLYPGYKKDNSAQPPKLSQKATDALSHGAGNILGCLFGPICVVIFGILVIVITELITDIGVGLGLPFNNDVASVVIPILVFIGMIGTIVVLWAKAMTKNK